jgi:CRP-like cAMP-binding protein
MHKNLDKMAVLRETGLFRNLSDSVLRTIAASAIIRHLKRGEVLYSEHEEASGLYVVGRGELRSIRQGIDGREQVLSTERAGAILAAVAVFNGGKFYSTMIADSDSEFLCIGKRYMYELCQRHTELLWNLAAILAHKVRHSADLIETLALRNVDQRVAQHLFTTCQERGVRDGKACVIELTMSRTEIASRLGSAREVVSRAFTHLEKSGLIQMQGRRLVTIPDMRALRSFAGSDPPLEKARSVPELSSEIA